MGSKRGENSPNQSWRFELLKQRLGAVLASSEGPGEGSGVRASVFTFSCPAYPWLTSRKLMTRKHFASAMAPSAGLEARLYGKQGGLPLRRQFPPEN
jgi:hypothetical protein